MSKEKEEDTTGKLIGKSATYNPNGADYGTRPKGKNLPALIVNSYDQEITVTEGEGEKKKTRKITREVVNLLVFQDSDFGVVRKQRVPKEEDALEGESFYSE